MKRRLIIIDLFLVLIMVFLTWYKDTFEMDRVEASSLNYDTGRGSVLIATQGSDYKNAITNILIEELGGVAERIDIIDAKSLEGITATEWDAIAIIHTNEIWMAPHAVRTFLKEHYNPAYMAVISTSGSGVIQVDGVDAITSASVMNDATEHALLTSAQIKEILLQAN